MFSRPVLCPDLLGALECHMFEHMGEPGAFAGVINRPDIDVGMESHHWRFMSFENDEVQAIREGKFSDFLLKLRERLANQGSGEECRHKCGACEALHMGVRWY